MTELNPSPNPNQSFYDTIARYYDAENEDMTADLAFYSEIATRKSEGSETNNSETDYAILDVGCGTGRVMLHLALEGHRVAGVDTSGAMLERGRRKLKNRADLQDLHDQVSFYEGNALNYPYPDTYALILLPYNALMHFQTPHQQYALLRHLAGALADDGLLVIDLPNAGEAFATVDDGAVTLERSFVEPESGHLVMQQSVSALNRTEQLQYITWIYDEIGPNNVVQRTVAPLVLRYTFPAELDLLLRVCGLRRIERYGDYDEGPFEEGCPRLIVVAAKDAVPNS